MTPQLTRRAFTATLLGTAAVRGEPARTTGLGGMMWEYTLDYLSRLDKRRKRRLESISSPLDLAKLQRRVRAKLVEMWGAFPVRDALNASHVGTVEGDDFLVEKLIYESRPGFFVTANLYRPKQVGGQLPAVIFPPGHHVLGKAYEPYQRFCALMARSGFIALTWDPISQGERLQLWDETEQASKAGPGTGEHRLLGNQCYLLGLNLMQYRAWDAIRAIDYLEARPEVDRYRIAMAGNSGGGMETLQLAPFESRIKVAISVSAVSSFLHKTQALLIADPEQILYGTLQHGIDHPELLAAVSPRPAMIGSPVRDYVPVEGARKTFQQVAELYSYVGAADRVTLVETDDEHGLNRELRQAAAGWLVHWLGNKGQRVGQEPEQVFAAEDLQCSESGQVAELDGENVLTLNRAYAQKIAPQRQVPPSRHDFQIYRSEIANKVREITRVGRFRPEAGILVPDRVFEIGPFAKGVAFVCADVSKEDPAVRRTIIDPLISAGYRVVALDLRGWGETEPHLPGIDVDFSWEDFFAYRAIEAGRPLLGQRMKDLLAAMRSRAGRREWLVAGVGAGALVAAHAAAVEPRIRRLITMGGMLSFRSLMKDPFTKQPFSSFLPGVLGAYDMRDVYASLAPRRVLVLNPQDSQEAPVDQAQAWEEFDWTSRVYEAAGAAGAFAAHSQLTATKIRALLSEWLSV